MSNSEIEKDILKIEHQIVDIKNNTKEYFKENLNTAIQLSDIEREETSKYLKNLQKNCESLNNLIHHFLQIREDFDKIEKLAQKISSIRKKCEFLSKKLNIEV